MSARTLSRRGFLVALGVTGAGVALASCGRSEKEADRINYDDPEIQATEDARFFSGNIVETTITAATVPMMIAGQNITARSYGDGPVGPEIRTSLGDELRVEHINNLDGDTIIHWHGIRIRNDMDGAPPITGEMAPPGTTFNYSFKTDHPGTFWYHSHSGLQADEAMLGPLIVEDPDDPYGTAEEIVIVLDDWVTGFGATPEELLGALNPALTGGHGGHGGHGASGSDSPVPPEALELTAMPHTESDELGGMVQHIHYPHHLINGHTTDDAEPLRARPGSTVRLRIINAAAETPYRVAIGGHTMKIIETDGFPCEPVEATSMLIGMAQRMDVLIDMGDEPALFVAQAEGSEDHVATMLQPTGSSATVPLTADLPELLETPVQDAGLTASDRSRLEKKDPDRSYELELIQSDDSYIWGIGGPDVGKVVMKEGERVAITMTNNTDMWHPMHLHGHTFAVTDYGGLRRDTVNILPGETLTIEFDADNPGAWMFHCHNAYHLDAGMTTNFYYER